MKRKVWAIFGVITASIVLILYLSGVIFEPSKYETDDWKILAKTNTSNGGSCFVRQRLTSFFFSDVKFGYVSPSGTKYSYPLEIDSFHWRGVRFVEKDGIIHVWRGQWEAAVFNPVGGYFTNLVLKHTFNESDGLYTGTGSSFFELEPHTNGSSEQP